MTATALNSRPNTKPSAHARFALDGSEAALIARLPQPAIAKLEHLRDIETRSRALASGLYETFRTTRDNLNEAKRQLAVFDKDWPPQTVIVEDTDKPLNDYGERPKKRVDVPRPERAQYAERVDRLTREVARLQAAQDEAVIGFNTSEILDWLGDQPPTAKFVAVPPPKMPATNLADIRTKADAVRARIAETRSAPAHPDELKAQMRAQIAELAERGKPQVVGGEIRWPTEIQVSVNHHTGASAVAEINNPIALAAWLHQDALIAKLEAAIDASADNSRAISASDRAEQLAALNNSLMTLLRAEEAVIVKIGNVPRISPLPEVLLGIEVKRS